ARIAFLQGERKGQENLKNDLIRRIKMLEFALKQERIKAHKLKYDSDPNPTELKAPVFDDISKGTAAVGPCSVNSNVSWRQGRQLLRQYLQEIGYTDTILDVRSARVRTLLGLGPANAGSGQTEEKSPHPTVNGGGGGTPGEPLKRPSDTQRRSINLVCFSLAGRFSDEMEDAVSADDEAEERMDNRRIKSKALGAGDDLGDADSESVLTEFDFLGPDSGEGGREARSQGDGSDWDGSEEDEEDDEETTGEQWGADPRLISQLVEEYRRERKGRKGAPSQSESSRPPSLSPPPVSLSPSIFLLSGGKPSESAKVSIGKSATGRDAQACLCFAGPRRPLMGAPGVDEDNIDASLGLGELAGLTVNNEAESSYDISATKESFRKTWNAKYTLRSHFDGVRALAFHPVEPVLITASEDHTLKLWNLQKTVPAKKTAALDVEPVYTFRGHAGPVLCLAMSATGEQCFSGGLDHTIRCWNVPSSAIDPYDAFEPSVLSATLWGHTDAVWSLSMHAAKLQLLSCSGDGTVRLWSPHSKVPLLHTYTAPETGDGIPTSVDFVRSDPGQMAVAYTTSRCVIVDLETGKPVIRLDSDQSPGHALSKQINCVVSHPTLPMTVTAHEDRHIRFFDNNTGKMVHSMVAHLDAVTSLAIDPNGLYLLSGSHDCSIRLWNLDNKTCVQEITSHRKKFDESIFDVAFHPSKPYIASAGADALAKVFV
ncbi:striatin, putative, partial [Ixodes scapularis]